MLSFISYILSPIHCTSGLLSEYKLLKLFYFHDTYGSLKMPELCGSSYEVGSAYYLANFKKYHR